jgi:hypothetical protein
MTIFAPLFQIPEEALSFWYFISKMLGRAEFKAGDPREGLA